MSQAVKGMTGSIKNLQGSASTVSLFALGQAASQLGQGLTTSFKETNAVFRDFEHQVESLGAITGAGADDMKKLEKEAFRLGSTTKFTAAESAQAMETFARAGLKPAEILSITSPALKLAIAENTELGLASEILITTMKQMGVPMKDAAKTANLLSGAASAANVSLDTIKETMKEAGVSAGQLGLSQTEILSLTGVLGNLGLQGSKSGTGIKNFLNALTDKTKIKKLNSLGIEIVKNTDGSLNFEETLKNVSKGMNNVRSSADRLGIIKDIFGQVGQSAAAGLSKNFANVEKVMSAIDEPALSLDQKFDKLSKTSKALEEGTLSASQAFQIALGQGFKPVGDQINKTKAELFKLSAGFLSESPIVAGSIMGVVGAGGFLIDNMHTLANAAVVWNAVSQAGNLLMLKKIALFPLVIGKMAALKIATAAAAVKQWLLNVALNANPLGLIVLGVMAVIAAITALVVYWDEVVAFFKSTWEFIKSIFGFAADKAGSVTSKIEVAEKKKNEAINKSAVDINVTAPRGTTVVKTGSPNVNLNLGEQD